MNVNSRTEGRITVLEVSGDIDGKTAPSFQEQVLARIDAEGRVLLDLRQVGFMSSAGLRSLLLTHREVGAKRATLVITGLNENIKASMSATGFLKFFAVSESLAEGLQALE